MMKRDKQGKFLPGKSGNPAGRALTESTRLKRQLAEHGTQLAEKVLSMALDGDVQALKICLDRISPPLRPNAQVVTFDYQPGERLTGAAEKIIRAASQGEIPPDTATQLLSSVGSLARTLELEELSKRLDALEKQKEAK